MNLSQFAALGEALKGIPDAMIVRWNSHDDHENIIIKDSEQNRYEIKFYPQHKEKKETEIDKIINSLTMKEKEVLIEAISPLYFEDRSDYIRGLWDIVNVLIGDRVNVDDIDVKEWLYALQPQLFEEA